MRVYWIGLVVPALLGAWLGVAVDPALPYPEDPPTAHTGGFGEPTCQRCHFDQPVNAPGGVLALGGVPEAYAAGRRYRLTVQLAKPAQRRGGFQMAVRFADGTQAGILEPQDDRVAAVWEDSSAVQYAHHTDAGTRLAAPDTAQWMLAWTAPAEAEGRVVFHVTANAANDDASEFGDFVYTGAWAIEEEQ